MWKSVKIFSFFISINAVTDKFFFIIWPLLSISVFSTGCKKLKLCKRGAHLLKLCTMLFLVVDSSKINSN